MSTPHLTFELIENQAQLHPSAVALRHKQASLSYAELESELHRVSDLLSSMGIGHGDRVAIYLPKQFETVIGFYATNRAGGVFVPINPVLKAEQAEHILQDSGASVLITSAARLDQLATVLAGCPDLRALLLVDEPGTSTNIPVVRWLDAPPAPANQAATNQHQQLVETDLAALLYTSGSTGLPKGVMVSHLNLVLGAKSVAEYLEVQADDRLLALLPLSFDYGLSQLAIAFLTGASVALFDYLLPQDVPKAVERYQITVLAAIPTLWGTLAHLDWPSKCSLRILTSSGGPMPPSTLHELRTALPQARVFLMYGLTEAFRSTYLPPDMIDLKPGSMGKAIPHADLHVLDANNKRCPPDTPGQLVHAGELVSAGYWRNPEKTSHRFGKLPGTETPAVWSGDLVKRDAQGYFWFLGRMDEMIKTSGYRVSPQEVEMIAQQCAPQIPMAAIGIPHPLLGQAILLVTEHGITPHDLLTHCRKHLPAYLVPTAVVQLDAMAYNANHKIDRAGLAQRYTDYFI